MQAAEKGSQKRDQPWWKEKEQPKGPPSRDRRRDSSKSHLKPLAMAEAQGLYAVLSWASGADEVLSTCFPRELNILFTGQETSLTAWRLVPDKEKKDGETSPLHVLRSEAVTVPEGVACIRQFPQSPRLAVSSNKTVILFNYTIRDGHEVKALTPCQQYCFNTEEINDLDIHSKETYICTCDDNGEIKVIDIDNNCLLRSLCKFHEFICSSVRFCPRNPSEIVSGGLDSKIGRWDISRGKLLAKVNTQRDRGNVEMMINPPMVHSMAVLRSQNCLACGLGDGRLSVYFLKNSKNLELIQEAKEHSYSVACVGCVEVESKAVFRSYIISAGNDGMMCLYLLESDRHGNNAALKPLDKLEGITKVNGLDMKLEGNLLTICTADVTGTCSLFNYMIPS